MHDRSFSQINNCNKKYMLATCRKLFEYFLHGSYMRIIPQHVSGHVRDACMKFLGINTCKIYMLVTCRKCFQINHVSILSTMVRGDLGCDFIGALRIQIRSHKNYQYSIEGQNPPSKFSTSTGNNFGASLVFSRKFITSTGFYRCCAPTHQHQ